MKTSNALHELILSLSASEKRYFKIFASRHSQRGKNNYMIIFDLVGGQGVYDEVEVLAALPNDKLRRQFAVMKNYLYKLILKSLRNFYAEQSIDFQLKELLMNVEILLKKGLERQSLRQLQKARKLALESEKYEYLLEVAALRLSLVTKVGEGNLDRLEHEIEDIFSETSLFFERYLKIQAYRKLSLQMLVLSRRAQHARTATVRKAYQKVIQAPIMENFDPQFSIRATQFYLQCQFVYHYAFGNYQESYEYAEKIVEHMEANPHLVAERPENYGHSMQNLVMISTVCCSPEDSLKLIERLKGFANRIPGQRFEPFIHRQVMLFAYNLEMHLLMENGKMGAAVELLSGVHELLDQHGYQFNVNEGYILVDFYFQIARLYLWKGDHEQAMNFVKRVLNEKGVGAEYEVYLNARTLQVLILFEAGEFQLLEYNLLSLYRFLRKRRKLYRLEKALLRFLSKASEAPIDKRLLPDFRRLRDELQQIHEDPEEPFHLRHIDIIAWMNRMLVAMEMP
ncbi:MAG TPA: hypothetical protein ENJ82_13970 [Bacteroidetes bacterium]|nr:hypothetical protein [Bacteroidota bacterium]